VTTTTDVVERMFGRQSFDLIEFELLTCESQKSPGLPNQISNVQT